MSGIEVLTRILSHLQESSRRQILAAAALLPFPWNELRLYRSGRAVLSAGGKAFPTAAVCTSEEIQAVLRYFCGNSLYAHSESIREGYIFTADGLRVGAVGRAVLHEGRIERIAEVSSLCIRRARRIPEAADALLPFLERLQNGGILVYSPPGVGKTTVLRELVSAIDASRQAIRCAVVDTRREITAGLSGLSVDVLLGYPRSVGMEIAVRSMAPEIVICDEIYGETDARAIRTCAAAGVSVIASAHAGSRAALLQHDAIRSLLADGVFSYTAALRRIEGQVVCEITEENGGRECCDLPE